VSPRTIKLGQRIPTWGVKSHSKKERGNSTSYEVYPILLASGYRRGRETSKKDALQKPFILGI